MVGWGGGLFDFSVYSWPSFNQKEMVKVGPGLGPCKDQELDNKTEDHNVKLDLQDCGKMNIWFYT